MPFAGFRDWDDCMAKTKRAHPDWGTDRCGRYCGAVKHRTEDAPQGRSAARRRRRGR